MISKIKSGKEARKALIKGLDVVADTVKVTIGPRGKNVVVDTGGRPIISNDAGNIAKHINLENEFEQTGAKIIKGVISDTSDDVGGGRTASAIITQAIVKEGLKHSRKGMNMNEFKRGIKEAVDDIIKVMKDNSLSVTTRDQLRQVATISTESYELGQVIADVMDKVGKEGVVTVEDSESFGVSTEIVEGLEFDKGFISPYMITENKEENSKEQAIHKDVPICVSLKKVISYKEVIPLIERVTKTGKKEMVIIAEDIEGEALTMFIRNRLMFDLKILAIKAPGFGDGKKSWLEDIASVVGATMVDDANGYDKCVIGSADKVISTEKSTVIVGGKGNSKAHIDTLKAKKEDTESKYEKDLLTQRIARLTGGVAVIKVGAGSEEEVGYLKQKIQDGVNETKRALEEGIIIGGDIAFINASKTLKSKCGSKVVNNFIMNSIYPIYESNLGYDTVLKAVEAPLRQIIENSEDRADIIIKEIKKSKSKTIGYNAITGRIVDNMFKEGIIDAFKVSKTVLENASSAASMFLTLEKSIVVIGDKVQKIDY